MKNTKFTEWFLSSSRGDRNPNSVEYDGCQDSWEACKKEVLEILKRARFNSDTWEDTPEKVMEEIEKL